MPGLAAHILRCGARSRQTDAILSLTGPARTRLLLAAGEIFSELCGRPLTAARLCVGQRTFSTIGKPGRLDDVLVRSALVFQVIRHQCVITDRRKIAKALHIPSQNLAARTLYGLRTPKLCGNRRLVPGRPLSVARQMLL